MPTKIHVANLNNLIAEDELVQLFARYGVVESGKIVGQSSTGRRFGFVVMGHEVEARAAIAALNGLDIEEQPLSVHEWRPRPNRNRAGQLGDGRSGGSTGRSGRRSRSDAPDSREGPPRALNSR
jgi:RNA recognition motif-containing protein